MPFLRPQVKILIIKLLREWQEVTSHMGFQIRLNVELQEILNERSQSNYVQKLVLFYHVSQRRRSKFLSLFCLLIARWISFLL